MLPQAYFRLFSSSVVILLESSSSKRRKLSMAVRFMVRKLPLVFVGQWALTRAAQHCGT